MKDYRFPNTEERKELDRIMNWAMNDCYENRDKEGLYEAVKSYAEKFHQIQTKHLQKEREKQLALCNVVDTLPADDLIKSLGEEKEPNEYILKTHNRVWWIEHKHVGSGEPLKQWLTGRPVSG